jgi:hypothetical protein
VDHEYIAKVLAKYGFGDYFINSFKTLYRDITATVMVNGYKTEVINIKRGVKQGDALSCAIFILCVDPLIRNLIANPDIKGINIQSRYGNAKADFKASGYADDIAIVCRSNNKSISEVFREYERLTRISGLELNADKTEILNLNSSNIDPKLTYNIKYLNTQYDLVVVSNLKICGLVYAGCETDEYKKNVTEKINKLEMQLRKWMVRHLTLEGKILIVKTFGLSQLIYNMQCYEILPIDLVAIERLIFKFLWSKEWKESRPIERISRRVLKNSFENGGLNAPDVDCLNRSLKLRQFLRCNNSNHPISTLQLILLNNIRYEKVLNQEYCRLVKDDPIIRLSQETINTLTDYDRSMCYGGLPRAMSSVNAIELASKINIEDYLKRKNEVFVYYNYIPLQEMAILNINELLLEREISLDRGTNARIENTILKVDKNLIQIAEQFNENLFSEAPNELFFLSSKQDLKMSSSINVKEFQIMLKTAYKKVEMLNVNTKNNLEDFQFDMGNIRRFRKQCKEVKMRNVFYRLLNRDFFYAERMFRYRMTDSPDCTRCGQTETNDHLLYNCQFSVGMWSIYNEVIKEYFNSEYSICKIEDIFNFNSGPIENCLKIKLINNLIQIERPKHWTKEKILGMALETKKVEKYIAIKNRNNLDIFTKKWGK